MRGGAARPAGRAKAGRVARGMVLASGTGRAATRGGGPVIELEYGITVYPGREEQGRWRAVWYENGGRQQCEAASEEKLAARLEKVTERPEADTPRMKLRGADLIACYLSPLTASRSRGSGPASTRIPSAGCACGSLPRSSTRSSARTSRPDTCRRSSTPRPRPGKASGSRCMISALAGAGLEGGYLANPRLAKVHWQAGDHPMPAPRMIVAGESALWVDPAEVWQPGRDRSNSRSSDPSCARTRFRPPTSTPRPVEPGNPTLSR